MTVRDAAEQLGVSSQRVHQLMTEGKLPFLLSATGQKYPTKVGVADRLEARRLATTLP